MRNWKKLMCKEFGTTKEIEDCTFIFPDGTMIAHQGMSHESMVCVCSAKKNTTLLPEFLLETGCCRVWDVSHECRIEFYTLTQEQIFRLSKCANKPFVVDLLGEDGESVYYGTIPFSKLEELIENGSIKQQFKALR